MKNFLIALLSLGVSTLMFSQSSFESDDLILLKYRTITAVNSNYLSAVIESRSAKRIDALENKVAHYDITKQAVFDNKSSEYRVTFEELNGYNGYITANFDAKGNLTSSFERFKDVSLPYIVRYSISIAYPNCVFKNNTYFVNHCVKKGTEKIYKIKVITANGAKKTLRVDPQGNFL
ncbi:hypothetical protein JJL45_12715 [Tamlana sp. s12]|uniref:hypothetical protein n=1 Tax=Tamlana sp. s12 TaxID=1630406 RepID=UPI0007FE24B6|nr:hypothetical protein [Tamlana sp. s12]OBQ56587.1 hypothetical protein VQ01_04380 [Tamlana sp. s12]QQY81776.1 hypothetical protein JJL45_12715 [Tamlana sp. s12]